MTFEREVALAVASAVKPLLARIAVLEARESQPGPAGEPGVKGDTGDPGPRGESGPAGKDADLSLLMTLKADVAAMQGEWTAFKSWQAGTVSEVMAKMVPPVVDESAIEERIKISLLRTLPMPKDGKDGVSIDPAIVDVMVAAQVEKAVAALPKPQDGQPGANGKDGANGQSVTVDDVRPLIAEEARKAFAAIPLPKDGKDGKPGADVVGLMIDRSGELILTLSDGSTKSAGVVVGRDGAGVDMAVVHKQIEEELAKWPRPKDGKDGFGFDHFDVVFDTEHGYRLRFAQGDEHKDFPVPFPWDAGTYTHGRLYPKSSCVTDRGAYWIAQEATSQRPPKLGEPRLASCPWRLAVKPGRDGKDAEPKKGDD